MSLGDDLLEAVVDIIDDPDFATQVTLHKGVLAFDQVAGSVVNTGAVVQLNCITGSTLARLVSDIRMLGNSSLMVTDRLLLLKGSDTVTDKDKIVFEGLTYSVLSIDPVKVGGIPVLLKVVLRR